MKKVMFAIGSVLPAAFVLADGTPVVDTAAITSAISESTSVITTAIDALKTNAATVCAAVLVLSLIPLAYRYAKKWLAGR